MQIFISATTVTGQKFSVLSLLLKVTCAVFRVKNLNCVSNVRIFLAQGGCSSLSLGWAAGDEMTAGGHLVLVSSLAPAER